MSATKLREALAPILLGDRERYTVPYRVSNGPMRHGTLTLYATDPDDALARAHAAYAAGFSATERKGFNKTMTWGMPVLASEYVGGL